MNDVVISVENLGKKFRIGTKQPYYRFSELLQGLFTNVINAPARWLSAKPSPVSANAPSEFWALKDVSFQVKQGQVVGIVGRNGAGKSTLLKLLSQITEPTTGRIGIRGRIASLLEVGTGFHPELTGRENIFLNGAILGMCRREIQSKFDEIVSFAEIEKFLDTPVKRFSSGMYTRLGFAIAAHLEPEILIVDEVLAVGDAEFQKKCLGKMGEVARGGRTVLFVSHNTSAVNALCNSAVLLDKGCILAAGDTGKVIEKYRNSVYSECMGQIWDDIATAPGNSQVRLHRVSVRRVGAANTEDIDVESPLAFEFDYWNLESGQVLSPTVVVFNEDGLVAFSTAPIDECDWNGRAFPKGLFRSTCLIPGNLLNDGTHTVQLHMIKDQTDPIFRYDHVLTFKVHDTPEQRQRWSGKRLGAVRPQLNWKTELLDDSHNPYDR